jgi:hypothetical protein
MVTWLLTTTPAMNSYKPKRVCRRLSCWSNTWTTAVVMRTRSSSTSVHASKCSKRFPAVGPRELDRAVQDLVDDSLEPQGVVDIFKAAGISKPDISILDDAFLQTFKDHPPESLQVKLLERG